MLEANFDKRSGAAVSGAYQYDTGQKIRLRGLPAPDELAEGEESPSGSVVVEAHFSFRGDRQSESRDAQWDEYEGVWTAGVPDAYLRKNQAVYIHVYVRYGADEEGNFRNKTMYEAVMTPTGRSAPNDTVTPEQESQWEAYMREVTEKLSMYETAVAAANGAAEEAGEAKEGAEQALTQFNGTVPQMVETLKTQTEAARDAAQTSAAQARATAEQWAGYGVMPRMVSPYDPAAVRIATDEATGKKNLEFDIPAGQPGPKGDRGKNDLDMFIGDGVLYIRTGV